MPTTILHDRRKSSAHRNLSEPWCHIPWTACVLVCIGAALLAECWYLTRLRSSADEIRREFEAAAAEMSAQLVPAPTPAVLAAMRRDFSGRDVTIAPTPTSSIIAVTLHGLDRAACAAATAKLRRIDGAAVVILVGYGAVEDCGNRNDMTWWIMP